VFASTNLSTQCSRLNHQRVVQHALTKWTNRVIDYRLRELNVIQRSEAFLLMYKVTTLMISHTDPPFLQLGVQEVEDDMCSSCRVTQSTGVVRRRQA
jgi:hypothetical protein